MENWTPAQYQDWWRGILAPYLPWIIAGVVALIVDAACSVVMLGIWLAERRR